MPNNNNDVEKRRVKWAVRAAKEANGDMKRKIKREMAKLGKEVKGLGAEAKAALKKRLKAAYERKKEEWAMKERVREAERRAEAEAYERELMGRALTRGERRGIEKARKAKIAKPTRREGLLRGVKLDLIGTTGFTAYTLVGLGERKVTGVSEIMGLGEVKPKGLGAMLLGDEKPRKRRVAMREPQIFKPRGLSEMLLGEEKPKRRILARKPHVVQPRGLGAIIGFETLKEKKRS